MKWGQRNGPPYPLKTFQRRVGDAVAKGKARIPEDISAVGYDGIRLAEVISPKLTTWRQSTTGLGREAAARLIELIEHPRTTLIDRQIVSGRLWEGESVKDLNSPEKEQR